MNNFDSYSVKEGVFDIYRIPYSIVFHLKELIKIYKWKLIHTIKANKISICTIYKFTKNKNGVQQDKIYELHLNLIKCEISI